MKVCPTCHNQYPDDANFCPREECAGEGGPQKLTWLAAPVPAPAARFTLVSRLGGQTSGELWQASDSETGEAVAYKKIAEEIFQTPLLKERCLRELKQLQRATSPRIARVIEAGRGTDGALFVVSELVAGERLDRVVGASGPMPLERAKRIVAQIGEALLDGQKVGLVHRELNAKNILLLGDDSLKVLNFTLPRAPGAHPLGIAEFMSPEQAEGKLVDQRSNTYSLGAILYFLLTGAPPVTGETVAEVIEAITKKEIAPPSIRRGGGLTVEVDRVVLKALDKSSSRRPLTLRQFLGEVAGLVVSDEEHLLTSGALARQHEPGSGPTKESSGPTPTDAGFTRTVMFAGGSAEIQKLVAEAVAARDAAAPAAVGEAVPSAGASRPEGTSASAAVRVAASNGRGETSAATSVGAAAKAKGVILGASPSGPAAAAASGGTPSTTPSAPSLASGALSPATSTPAAEPAPVISAPVAVGEAMHGGPTPPPSHTPAPASQMPAGAPSRPAAEAAAPGGNFRETLWFKKGDVDQMVADARAKMASAAAQKAEKGSAGSAASDPVEVAVSPVGGVASHGAVLGTPTSDSGPSATAEVKPLEDRYLDDGTVTVDDRKKFSLRSGPNTAGHPLRGAAVVPGERMSETEVLDEIGGGRRLLVIALVVVVGLAAAGVIWALTRGAGHGGSPTPVQVPTAEPSAPAPPAPTQAEPVTPPSPSPSTSPSPPPSPSGEAAPLAAPPSPGSTEPSEPAAAGSADLAQGGEPSSSRSSARKKSATAGKKKAAATAKKNSSSTKPHR
jgi:serine/threonine-protein kinase